MSHLKSEKRIYMNPQNNPVEDSSTYDVNGKVFIVTPVFRKEGSETLGEVLLKLMKSEYSA